MLAYFIQRHHPALNTMNIEQARFNMIEQQIRPWRVNDGRVLGILAEVRREDFVPAASQGMAFADTEVPLNIDGHASGQVMLAPKVEARLLQDLAIQPHEKVLEVGTGSGYGTCPEKKRIERGWRVRGPAAGEALLLLYGPLR